ncbi:MAG: peptidylprolyl isomerase [Cyanobacteria bacterium P01_F01_bin.150]
MAVVLNIGTRAITADEILPLMAGYQMFPKFLQELVIDEAIANVECTAEEQASACQQFYAQQQIADETARQEWLKQYGMTQAQLENLAARGLRIEKYKQDTWGIKLESYFLERKGTLDKVIYSLIRTKDVGIAQEVYFRINDGEQTFAELAREYSQGPEAQTDGLIGPVELNVPHPALANLLSRSKPGELSPPTRVGEWMVIVRLERFIPCQMDDAMRRRLLDEQFNTWLREKMQAVDAVFAHSHQNKALSESATASQSLAANAVTQSPPTGIEQDAQKSDASLPDSTPKTLQDPWDESTASSSATEPSPT